MANHQGKGAQYPSLSTPSLLGGKAFGALKKQQEDDLDVVNQVRESKAVNKQMLHTHRAFLQAVTTKMKMMRLKHH